MKLSFTTDEQAWQGCHEEDKWCFNKLEVAQRFGVTCGLREEPIPTHIEKVVVRPIYNLSGMGLGATLKDRWEGEATEEQCPLGFFWAEYIEGDVLSVDYTKKNGEVEWYCARGTRDELEYVEWFLAAYPPFPPELAGGMLDRYEWVNVEYVDFDTPIEIHLRPNPDLKHFTDHDVDKIIPIFAPKGKFIPDQAETNNGQRLGFIIPEDK